MDLELLATVASEVQRLVGVTGQQTQTQARLTDLCCADQCYAVLCWSLTFAVIKQSFLLKQS